MDDPAIERSDDAGNEHAIVRQLLAWSVHLLTAGGVVCSLLALEATFAGEWRTALMWLLVAVVIDSVDGTFARLVSVKQVIPNFDGALLDNLVDYVNYVVVPALIMHRAGLLPANASFAVTCAICLASAYQFCQNDAKTPDHFFKGFPSYWNVAALYLLSLRLGPTTNLAVLIALVAMVFVPIKYLYVTRTVEFRAITLPLTILWGAMAVAILWQLPDPNPVLVRSSVLYFVYYFCASSYLTMRRTAD